MRETEKGGCSGCIQALGACTALIIGGSCAIESIKSTYQYRQPTVTPTTSRLMLETPTPVTLSSFISGETVVIPHGTKYSYDDALILGLPLFSMVIKPEILDNYRVRFDRDYSHKIGQESKEKMVLFISQEHLETNFHLE